MKERDTRNRMVPPSLLEIETALKTMKMGKAEESGLGYSGHGMSSGASGNVVAV